MTKYFLAFITSALLFFNSCSNGQSQSSNTNLSAKEFDKKINQLPGAPVIDVSKTEELSKGHVEIALNIDRIKKEFETIGTYSTFYFFYKSDSFGVILAKWKAPDGYVGNFYQVSVLSLESYYKELEERK